MHIYPLIFRMFQKPNTHPPSSLSCTTAHFLSLNKTLAHSLLNVANHMEFHVRTFSQGFYWPGEDSHGPNHYEKAATEVLLNFAELHWWQQLLVTVSLIIHPSSQRQMKSHIGGPLLQPDFLNLFLDKHSIILLKYWMAHLCINPAMLCSFWLQAG